MTNITDKPRTVRTAVARGDILLTPRTVRMIEDGKIPKGNVLCVAQVAGILAAKRTDETLPLCHPLNLSGVSIKLVPKRDRISIESTVNLVGQTGAEMEALLAVSIAALTIYDMCKPVDKTMVISNIRLVKKTGGRSGTYMRKGGGA
jgi:cyclic pyranopterin phosphate synthase